MVYLQGIEDAIRGVQMELHQAVCLASSPVACLAAFRRVAFLEEFLEALQVAYRDAWAAVFQVLYLGARLVALQEACQVPCATER